MEAETVSEMSVLFHIDLPRRLHCFDTDFHYKQLIMLQIVHYIVCDMFTMHSVLGVVFALTDLYSVDI